MSYMAALTAPGGHLSLRTTASPAGAAAFLRQIVAELDPRQLVTIQTTDELLTTVTAQPRFIAWLLTAFAAFALLLAAAGLHSVASYLVLQRRRDIGIRMAIGASPRDVARQVVGEAGRWIIGGALVGSALGWMGTRALQSQLYQVEALGTRGRGRARCSCSQWPGGGGRQACLLRRPRGPGHGAEVRMICDARPITCALHPGLRSWRGALRS